MHSVRVHRKDCNMTAREKTVAKISDSEVARIIAKRVNADGSGDGNITIRTVRKARQGRAPALERIAAKMGYKDDADTVTVDNKVLEQVS